MWLRFQELRREGFWLARQRVRAQRPILGTRPLRTASSGTIEIRVLTWKRDWVNLIWALKSFYHYAGVDYPLVIHDGGLLPEQVGKLLNHFPNARFIPRAEGDEHFVHLLRERGFDRSADFRQKDPLARKLFDFHLASSADYVLTIDSDVLFFRRPDQLLLPPEGLTRNRYNRDYQDGNCWYSMPSDELNCAFGIRPPPLINSGLAIVRRSTIDFSLIEKCLGHPKLSNYNWLTEQTLHALCSTVHGVEFLPPEYQVGGPPGLGPGVVCKHYPGSFRHQMYTDGIPTLISSGFIEDFNAGRE